MEKNFDFYKKPDEIKREAKDIMSGSWGFSAKQMAIALVLTLIIVGAVTALSVVYAQWFVIVPAFFVGLFLIYVIYYGVQVFCYNLTNKLTVNSALMFAGFSQFFKLLWLFVLKLVMLALGLCMVVYFGFSFELAYSMSELYLCDNTKSKTSAILKGSKRLMKGNKKRLIKLRLKNIGWILLCLTVVGSLWALPYLQVQKSVFYNDLKSDF